MSNRVRLTVLIVATIAFGGGIWLGAWLWSVGS